MGKITFGPLMNKSLRCNPLSTEVLVFAADRLRPRLDSTSFHTEMKHFCCSSAFLSHDNGVLVPLKLQTFENAAFFFGCVNWQTAKPVKAVTTLMLMLMLVQVNAFHNSHDQTQIKHSAVHQKQVEYGDSLLRRIRVLDA